MLRFRLTARYGDDGPGSLDGLIFSYPQVGRPITPSQCLDAESSLSVDAPTGASGMRRPSDRMSLLDELGHR
jgi:hypothetical protein